MTEPLCPGCRRRDARIAELERRVAELETLVRELLARLGQNASNSSVPPSANPPAAPPPVVKQKTGRKPGGQPGHPPYLRQLVPPERVTRVEPLIPGHCGRCQTPLPLQAGPDDPPPLRHPVADLPALRAEVVEYQGHARIGPACGPVTQAPIPAAVRAHSIGPGLAATLSYLAGCHHVSKRGLEEISEALFEVPVALGTVANLEQEMSAALAPAHAEAIEVVRQAKVKHVDETGWKQAGQKCWRWLAATTSVAAFLIHPRRSLAALTALLGAKLRGFVCSDRGSAYDAIAARRRQVCWAHLKRDFQKCSDRGGAAVAIGEAGRKVVQKVFKAWHLFRGGGCTRARLQRRLSPVARPLREDILEAGRGCADSKVARFCEHLIALEPALWRFVGTAGVEPTNNHAERLLRRGVLWRKNAFGCSSTVGCRFVERILTAVQTLRLQRGSVLTFLRDSLIAHRAGLPTPKLVLEG
jgi:transposase